MTTAPLDQRSTRLRPVHTILGALLLVVSTATLADAREAWRAIDQNDCKRAGEEINKGIEKDEAEAYFLGGYLFDATGCVDQDLARAAKYYRRAAELGYGEAANFLAMMHGLGRGVPQDYKAAYDWFVLASTNRGAPPPADAAFPVLAGYARTVTQLARAKVRYPTLSERESIDADVVVIFDTASGAVTFKQARAGAELGSNVPKTGRFTDAIADAYEAAVREAPRPEGVEKRAYLFEVPWAFRIERRRL